MVSTAKKTWKTWKIFLLCDKIQNVMVEQWWKPKFFFSWLNIYVKDSTISVDEFPGASWASVPIRAFPWTHLMPCSTSEAAMDTAAACAKTFGLVHKFVNVRCPKICYFGNCIFITKNKTYKKTKAKMNMVKISRMGHFDIYTMKLWKDIL